MSNASLQLQDGGKMKCLGTFEISIVWDEDEQKPIEEKIRSLT
ncbi:hypothetical protein PAEVO_31490 [Paenibacillus sp. GM2FR]|nr:MULTISPECIES: hypothetical protein [Paenibacillus]MEC0257273.1 hypothetical protein [Paenibacillus lautus]PJN56426.1 hypothetical protein PAEVO_31490 [Paenibacillus sp. GM2FR]